jgi:hypothetical protein
MPDVTFQNNQYAILSPALSVDGNINLSNLPSGGSLSVSPATGLNVTLDIGLNTLTAKPVDTTVSGTFVITYTDPGTTPTSVSTTVEVTSHVPTLNILSSNWSVRTP